MPGSWRSSSAPRPTTWRRRELAAWIIESRADYRLVDLRTEAEFAQYHIPTALSIPMSVLTDAGLGRQEKIVLYSEGGIHSAQAWMLLKAQGYKSVYMLKGGLDEWKDQVVFPVVSDNPTPVQRARDERLKSMSTFFGGQPRSAAAVATGAPATPAVAAPQTPAVPMVAAPAVTCRGREARAPRRRRKAARSSDPTHARLAPQHAQLDEQAGEVVDAALVGDQAVRHLHQQDAVNLAAAARAVEPHEASGVGRLRHEGHRHPIAVDEGRLVVHGPVRE